MHLLIKNFELFHSVKIVEHADVRNLLNINAVILSNDNSYQLIKLAYKCNNTD